MSSRRIAASSGLARIASRAISSTNPTDERTAQPRISDSIFVTVAGDSPPGPRHPSPGLELLFESTVKMRGLRGRLDQRRRRLLLVQLARVDVPSSGASDRVQHPTIVRDQ